jgi:[ribosomal protein S18]-alanine N-acetyltransferase
MNLKKKITYRLITIMNLKKNKPTFINLKSEDIDRILEIERYNTNAWTKESFKFEIEKSSHSKNIGLCINDDIIAYCVAWMILDELHIGQITVDPDYRRNGYAEMILKKLFSEFKEYRSCHLEVSSVNTAAIRLYKKFGFEEKAVRKRYYKDGTDAILMEKDLRGIT